VPTLLDNHRVFTASIFKDIISDQSSANVYFTFGKKIPWANEASPDTANTSPAHQSEVWQSIIGFKRITGNDVQHCIPRYDWTANTVYTQYDQNSLVLGQDNVKFYAVNSDFNVYKCLYNNNGANSTVEPTATNPDNITQTADGYTWKFMYSIAGSEQIRFTTGAYIPVKTLASDDGSLQWDVQDGATDGAIYGIILTSGGANYSNNSNISVTINGDGTGAAATANINLTSGLVHTITLSDYGTGYTNASVIISGGAGTGATAKALIGPQGGHGSNPLYELIGKNLILNPRLINSEGGVLSVANDYRQVAILVNPLTYGDRLPAGNSAYSQTTELTVSGIGADYVEDEYVYQGASLAQATFYGTVVEYDSINTVVKITNTSGIPISDPLIGASSAASKYVTSIDYPDLAINTGEFLYVDNIEPISRNVDQSEDFKIIIKM
jgi:hypothetical protein